MQKGRVLVIEADASVSDLLANVLQARGYEVSVTQSARDGFRRACEWVPDCIICDVDLPDIDGFYVARRIRTEHTPVATTPFLFLMPADDRESRLQGFHVGADAYLTKPLTDAEVVAQVEALMDMARRLRVRRDSFLETGGPSSHPGPVAFKGDLAQMSLPTVLTILEMERRSGELKVTGPRMSKAVLSLVGNGFGECSLNGKRGTVLEVLREVLQWKKGRFSFKPKDGPPVHGRSSIGMVLLEALRLDDESEAAAIDIDFNPPTSKRHDALAPAPVIEAPARPAGIPPLPPKVPVKSEDSLIPISEDTPAPPSVRDGDAKKDEAPKSSAKPEAAKPAPPKADGEKPEPPKPEPTKSEAPKIDEVDDSWDA